MLLSQAPSESVRNARDQKLIPERGWRGIYGFQGKLDVVTPLQLASD